MGRFSVHPPVRPSPPLGHPASSEAQPARPQAQLARPQASGLAGWASGLAGWPRGGDGWMCRGMDVQTYGRMDIQTYGHMQGKSPHSTGLHPLSGSLPKKKLGPTYCIQLKSPKCNIKKVKFFGVMNKFFLAPVTTLKNFSGFSSPKELCIGKSFKQNFCTVQTIMKRLERFLHCTEIDRNSGHPSVGPLVCWSVDQSVCWSVSLLVSWSISLLVCQSIHSSIHTKFHLFNSFFWTHCCSA